MKRISEKQKTRIKRLNQMIPPSDGKCQECDTYAPLHKHHIKHRSQGGDDNVANLKWLCGLCHLKAHNIKVIASDPMWSKERQINNETGS